MWDLVTLIIISKQTISWLWRTKIQNPCQNLGKKCQSIMNWYFLGFMAYFKPSYGVNGLGIPMGPMDAATLHHSMGYTGKVFKKLFHYHFYCFDRFYFILMTSFSLLQHESYMIGSLDRKKLLLYHWSQFVLSNTIFCQILWKCRCILVTFTSHWKK